MEVEPHRMKPADRQRAIVLALESSDWCRAEDLAQKLRVCARTVYRDIEALQNAGLPVVGVRGQGFQLREGFFLPPITFTLDEAVLVLARAGAADEVPGIAYQAAAHTVRAKLLRALPDDLGHEVARLQARLRVSAAHPFDPPGQREALALIRQAMHETRAVRSMVLQQEVTINPYALERVAGVFYLVGLDHARDSVRYFRVDGLTSLRMLSTTFTLPAAYRRQETRQEPAAALSIEVRFDAQVAPWIREAPPVFASRMEDVGDDLHVTLHVQQESEVLSWLLSWGARVEVLAPASLQRRLAEEASALLAYYQRPSTLFI